MLKPPTKADLERAEHCCAHLVLGDGNFELLSLWYCLGWAGAMQCDPCREVLTHFRPFASEEHRRKERDRILGDG